jgi:hypothetical protein
MRNQGRFPLRCAPALLALLLAGGCSLPGTFGVSNEPGPSKPPPGTAHPPTGPIPVGPVVGPGPSAILPLNLAQPESPQDQASLLSQKLHGVEDDRNLLAARLLQLETTLQDKEKALTEATEDIGKTGEEINRARADIRRMKQENADLRDKLDRSQREVIDLRKQMIKQMEKDTTSAEGETGKERP